LPDEAKHITITDDESLREANGFYQACKTIVENIHRHMDPVRDANYKSWKESIKLIQKLEELPLQAMKTVKPKMIAYKEKVQEEIRKKEKEAQDKIDAEKKKAEALLEKAAEQEKAEAMEEKVQESTMKMKEIPEAPKTKGVTMRKIPKWRVIEETQIPSEYMIVDAVKIGAVVRAAKGDIKIPGIEVYFETV
jgi:dsDNA-specific endonuclease/ATPase MutS2